MYLINVIWKHRVYLGHEQSIKTLMRWQLLLSNSNMKWQIGWLTINYAMMKFKIFFNVNPFTMKNKRYNLKKVQYLYDKD